jgi:beta-lactamase regulating signal transducer with metallopeptidase domain
MTEVLEALEITGRGIPAWLWLVTLWTGAAWLVARTLDGLLRRQLAPAWRIPLYAVVLVRLLLPLDWSSPLSPLPSPSPAQATNAAPAQGVAGAEALRPSPSEPPVLIGSAAPAELAAVGEMAAAPTGGWGVLVLLAWLVGSALLLGRLALQRGRLRRLALACAPAPARARPLDPRIDVLIHPIAGPLAFGLLRPTIVLPRALLHADPQVLRFVLAHEHAHLARHDPAWAGAAALVVALAWPVLPLWLAARRVRTLLELAADERAVAESDGRWREYGRAMIELAADRPRGPLLALGLFSHVRERVAALRPRARPRPWAQAVLGVTVPVAVLACAGVPEPEPPEPTLAARCEAQAEVARSVPPVEAEHHAAELDALVARYQAALDAGQPSEACRNATRDALAAAATGWHDLAEQRPDERLRTLAGHAYSRFIALFPGDPDAYTMQYYYAELLWSQAMHAHDQARREDAEALFVRSVQEFVEVLDRDPAGRYTRDAARAQLLATRNAGGEPTPPAPPAGAAEPLPRLTYGPRAQALADSYRRYFDHAREPGIERGRVAHDWGRLAMQHHHFDEARMPLGVALDELDGQAEAGELAVRAAEMEVDRLTIAWTRAGAGTAEKAAAAAELAAFLDELRARPLWDHPEATKLHAATPVLAAGLRGERTR